MPLLLTYVVLIFLSLEVTCIVDRKRTLEKTY